MKLLNIRSRFWGAALVLSVTLFVSVGNVSESVAAATRSNQASIVSQLVPDQVSVGETFTAIIQVKNSGRTTWSRPGGYHLAALGPNIWGVERLELDDNVRIAPGETATFKAQVTAPQFSGDFAFRWQMRVNTAAFGQPTPLVNVRVGKQSITRLDSEFVYQNVSPTMLVGESHQVAVQFKNTSETDWHAGDVFLVGLGAEGLVWALERVEMKGGAVISPGEFVVFRFNVQAPLEPGSYAFQWQLRHRRGGVFGSPSELLSIDVR